jgi:hypothetical protein
MTRPAGLGKAASCFCHQMFEVFPPFPEIGISVAQSFEPAAFELGDNVDQKIFSFCATKSLCLGGNKSKIPDDYGFRRRQQSGL